MKYSKLYVPENLDLIQFIEFRAEYRYKILFLISTLYFRRVTKKFTIDGFIPLSQEILHRFINRRYVKRVRDDLIKLKIIELDQSGKRGTKGNGCLGYRFTEKYRDQKFKTIPNPYPKEREEIEVNNPAHKYILSHFKDITILPEAEDEIENILNEELDLYRDAVHARNCAIISKDWIDDSNWFFKVDRNTGRVFHNICNLHKRIRPFLRFKGERMVEMDISNCQPLLLYYFYPDKGTEEAKRYLALVEGGKFYELIQVLCENLDRDKLKKNFLTYLFSKNHWDVRAGEAFKGQFPELAARIHGMKVEQYNALAIELQKLEADLVINTIVPLCANRGIPAITIHDSILTLPEWVDEVREMLKGECERMYGIVPTVKVK